LPLKVGLAVSQLWSFILSKDDKPSNNRTDEDNTRTTGAAIGGAIFGASIGGPFGAIIGGILGAIAGESANESKKDGGDKNG
jgi:outer membrane lipoprotein SlyB